MSTATQPLYLSAEHVRRELSIAACIPLIGPAMIALSNGEARQLLRSFIPMGPGRAFAQMPAALSERGYFGAKLVSVFADPENPGHRAHQGMVVMFEGKHGRLVCMGDAGEITRIRTAAASAVATEALARPDARSLAILGAGVQARAHLESMLAVRDITEIRLWARNAKRVNALATFTRSLSSADVRLASSARAAVDGADIICTLTSASEPILEGAWVAPGAHVNVVGSSAPQPAEVANDLVAKSRFIADHREHVLAHGAEFLRAKRAGLVDDAHVVAEIGEVLMGAKAGRTGPDDITLYKSLGHAVQDLAALAWLYERHHAS